MNKHLLNIKITANDSIVNFSFQESRKILAVQTCQAVLFYYIQREKSTCTFYTVKSQATKNI